MSYPYFSFETTSYTVISHDNFVPMCISHVVLRHRKHHNRTNVRLSHGSSTAAGIKATWGLDMWVGLPIVYKLISRLRCWKLSVAWCFGQF